jgi:general secretion pathway protein G
MVRILRRAGTRLGNKGWTFVETLVVIAIIMILTGTVGFVAVRAVDRAKVVAARSQLEAFEVALNGYLLDNGAYPTQEQGLAALREKPTLEPLPQGWAGPYLFKPVPKDPWGKEYMYTVPGPGGLPYGIRTFGSDGHEGGDGTAADITSWTL